MICPVCHIELEGSPRFCNKCGSNIEATRPTNAPTTEVAADAFIGQIVGGRYKIIRLLGEGGMGAVYLGEQNIGGTMRKVAIKTLHQHLSSDPKIKQRFERECATVAELQHPNTIQLYDYGTTEDGILYMVMEFVQGESLASILEKRGTIDAPRTQHILQQICDALGEAHALGIVHRDLKPDNIVLTERAKDWVKVLDFGIAKRSETPDRAEQKLTQQGTVLGTPPYMSPEQFTGKPIDARSDIYSIGVMAYEMLSGTLPFSATTPWEWAAQHMTVPPTPLATTPSGVPLPPAMTQAIMRSLAKDPEQRFPSTKEFFDAFSAGAPAETSGGTAVIGPGYGPVMGPLEQQGKTQIGAPIDAPAGAYGPPGYGGVPGGAAPGILTGGYAGGATPAAGNVAFPVMTAIRPGPALPEQKSGGGKGLLILLLALVGLLSAGAVVVALTRHSPPTSVAGGSPPSAAPVPTHAELSATAAPVDPVPLDTSVPPLTSSGAPPPSPSNPGPGKKLDAGGAAISPPPPPPSAPASSPSSPPPPPPPPTLTTPNPTPTLIPATIPDPRSCQKARALRAKNREDYKHRVELEKLEEQCARAGGQL
jgi:eukaryotic-like serine/threonine-protein kinase